MKKPKAIMNYDPQACQLPDGTCTLYKCRIVDCLCHWLTPKRRKRNENDLMVLGGGGSPRD